MPADNPRQSESLPLFCTRRRFVAGLAAAAAVSAAGGLLAACAVNQNNPPSAGEATLSLDDGNYAALNNPGGVVKFPWKGSPPFIVRNTGSAFEAFSSYCTHKGCEVDLPSGNTLTATGIITCPCHGAKFDADGKRLAGPTHINLYQAQVTVSGRVLTIIYG